MEAGEFAGRPFEVYLTPLSGWKTPRVGLVGAGKREEFTTERMRRIATAAALAARQRRVTRIAWLVRGDIPSAARPSRRRSRDLASRHSASTATRAGSEAVHRSRTSLSRCRAGGTPSCEPAFERGRILAESCNITRELCNEPPNVLTPHELGQRAIALGQECGFTVEVLDEKELERLGMGLLLGVGQGSAQPPRMIVLRHTPKGKAASSHVLGLVGKGVTFDTGGISIKPAENMERMKTDMSGAAAVLGAMRAISLLDAPMQVIGIIPAAENMPGGRAIKPADILTGAGGKTVEVINTDAEGRLILGDGLWYAKKLGATHLVDVATLTGAIVIALGKVASGLFGQPEPWVDVVKATSEVAGDRCWPMPLYDEYGDQLKSDIADMINSGGRPAGACTAAMFLKEFAGGLPWAHIDIAGTAWAEDAKPWQAKGPTGVAVRTLAELAFTSHTWNPGPESVSK